MLLVIKLMILGYVQKTEVMESNWILSNAMMETELMEMDEVEHAISNKGTRVMVHHDLR